MAHSRSLNFATIDMLSSLRRRTALAAIATLAVLAALPTHAQDKNTLKVGVSVGNAEQVFEVVKKVAARDGLKIEVVVFNDYIQPNAALAAGDLDANGFQHQPFLDNQIKARGYEIVPVGLIYGANGLLLEEVQVVRRVAGRRDSRYPERSVERQSRAVAAAKTASSRSSPAGKEHQRDATRRGCESEEAQAGAARLGAVAAFTRRSRCRHQ